MLASCPPGCLEYVPREKFTMWKEMSPQEQDMNLAQNTKKSFSAATVGKDPIDPALAGEQKGEGYMSDMTSSLQGDPPLTNSHPLTSLLPDTEPSRVVALPPEPARIAFVPSIRSQGMTKSVRVAIIGAGPYGLSIAAHLRARGVGFRIFGNPMESWRTQMPAGMLLKSEGFASNLYDPKRSVTLKHFCTQMGVRYEDLGLPIPVEVMASYGLYFQKQLIPDLENQSLVALDRSSKGFVLELDNGETLTAQHVILAVGSSCFKYIPPTFAHLTLEFISHSSQHHDLSQFAGHNVTVLGSGSSALDLAALLHEGGAQVSLVARRSSLVYLSKPRTRTLWHHVRYPVTGIGQGWRSRFFTDTPMLFRYLPQQTRLRTIKTYLGPAGGWFIKDRIEGHVRVLLACTPAHAEVRGGRVYMQLSGEEAHSELVTDHVIAATGYRIDVGRLSFLSEKIRSSLHSIESAPVLSRSFESSVPGLYFVGLASAPWFGPVMRFMFGAGYTARRLSEHLASLEAF